MISSLKTAIPRLYENLKYLVMDANVEVADGQLASFVIFNNSLTLVAEFSPASPRSTVGRVRVVDGSATVVLDLPGASIQVEQGPPDPSWPGVTLGAIVVTGIDTAGRVWVGRSTGPIEADPTSIGFEMAVSSEPTAGKQLNELAKWLLG